MASALALKMKGSGGGKKKPGFMESAEPSNSSEEDETGSSDMATGDDGKSASDGMVDNSSNSDDDDGGNLPDDGEGREMGSYDAVEDDAASELAGIVGVPEDKREAFKSALSDYVAACVKKQGRK
jgi:hypothetical protein